MELQKGCTYQDSWYVSLLGLAEYFRTCQPIRIRECIRCLEALAQLTLPGRIGARTHLQLGQMYAHYTKNNDLARMNLEKALAIGRLQTGCEDVIGESSCALANIYCQNGDTSSAKELIYQALENVKHQSYWYCRLLLYLSQLHVNDSAYALAHQLLSSGVDYTNASGAMYANALFLLTKGMLLIIEKRAQDANSILIKANNVIENLTVSPLRKQSLKSFLLVLQVCYCLSSGNVRGGKQYLKELQLAIQTIIKTPEREPLPRNPLDCFQWMPNEYLCVVVYIVTLLHEMQAGQYGKAQMYADKALVQVDKLMQVDDGACDLFLHGFKLLLVEHSALCHLVMGNRSLAIKRIQSACDVCSFSPKLFEKHKAQLHTLLGLYGISTNCLPAAESQFNIALQMARDTDLWTFINLNLAIIYVRTGNEQSFQSTWEKINPTQLQSQSQVLKASTHYVKGLREFFCGRYIEAKTYLREALLLSNAENMERITSCAVVVLGHIFLLLKEEQQDQTLIPTSYQLSRKLSDVSVQLWSIMLLREVYKLRNDVSKLEETEQIYNGLLQTWIRDHQCSVQQPEHKLLEWLDGPCPSSFALENSLEQYPVNSVTTDIAAFQHVGR